MGQSDPFWLDLPKIDSSQIGLSLKTELEIASCFATI